MTYNAPRDLPGFRKKSFSLPYNGGEIWFEHLDGIYGNESLVLEKLSCDCRVFRRPSLPSLIGFVLNETDITSSVVSAIQAALTDTDKVFCRVCFIGTDRTSRKALESALRNRKFALAFINNFDEAKDWLVRESP